LLDRWSQGSWFPLAKRCHQRSWTTFWTSKSFVLSTSPSYQIQFSSRSLHQAARRCLVAGRG
jgi:hypothetical protein